MRKRSAAQTLAISILLILTASAFVAVVVPAPAEAATTSTTSTGTATLVDYFTQDSDLNTAVWRVNGAVGSALGLDDIGQTSATISLLPSFSSAGMEIAQANNYSEVGTIQSIRSFVPPFNATAVVEGTLSDGHTFGFAVASAGAASGVMVYGNLNSTNCSALVDCGDPDTCAIPPGSTIATGSCFYGIDVKTGSGGSSWTSAPKLYLTPDIGVFYTVQISVDASGLAEYSVGQGGEVLGESSSQVGTGPFYIVLEQAEGAPTFGPGPNDATWQSVLVNPPTASFSVYPTEPSYRTITLNYTGQSLSSPIHVAVTKGADFPLGLNVTLRAQGTKSFTKTLDLQPSSTGHSTIMLNFTLDCVTGKCNQPGGTQLPTDYNATTTATSGSYSQSYSAKCQLAEAKWLVMVYSAADTGPAPHANGDLEFGMANNLVDMAKVSGAHDNPAVAILDLFSAGWSVTFTHAAPGTTAQPADSIRLYKVANGTITQVGGNWPETADNNPGTLSKFIASAMAMDPAEHNQLVISDHGAGIQGIASDYNNGGTYMSIPQLSTALSGIPAKLDILSFDACLMAQIDVLYQLRNYASYFTASELTVPGLGYNYTGFLGSLLINPDQSTVSYLNVIVTSYAIKYLDTSATPPEVLANATLAAIDASQLGGVVSALNTLSGALLQDYSAHSVTFNATMLAVLLRSSYVDVGLPYADVRSVAQNILLSPQITDQNLRSAAAGVVQAVKAAVIANCTDYAINGKTATRMYEGLTTLLFPTANYPRLAYQMYAGFDNQLSYSNAAHWLPLLRAVNQSASLAAVGLTLILLVHPGHQLFLSVYDAAGGETGVNPALVNQTRTEIELIPGSNYFDLGNGSTLIALPLSLQSFTTLVDGTSMLEATEQYTLTYTVIQNGTVTSTRTVQGTIQQNTLQSAAVVIRDGVVAVGATNTSSTSLPTTSTVSSAKSASSTASSTSYTMKGLIGVTIAAAAVAVISLVALRRRPQVGLCWRSAPSAPGRVHPSKPDARPVTRP